MAKRKKRVPSKLPTILIAVGLIMMGIWGLHRFLYARSLSLSDALVAAYKSKHAQTGYPLHITVGQKISLRVVESTKAGGTLAISPTAANHFLSSALPGENGNVIIYGHNLNSVFGYLVDARIGDPVVIYTDDGKRHAYKITDIHIVDPSQTELLAPTTTEVVTLYTCTGLLDSLRFVARATPVK